MIPSVPEKPYKNKMGHAITHMSKIFWRRKMIDGGILKRKKSKIRIYDLHALTNKSIYKDVECGSTTKQIQFVVDILLPIGGCSTLGKSKIVSNGIERDRHINRIIGSATKSSSGEGSPENTD